MLETLLEKNMEPKIFIRSPPPHIGFIGPVAYLQMLAKSNLSIAILPSESEDFPQCLAILSRVSESSDGRLTLKKLHDEVFTFQRQLSETEDCKKVASDIAAEFDTFLHKQPQVEAKANVFSVSGWFFHINLADCTRPRPTHLHFFS
jgi:hypothetical protein